MGGTFFSQPIRSYMVLKLGSQVALGREMVADRVNLGLRAISIDWSFFL